MSPHRDATVSKIKWRRRRPRCTSHNQRSDNDELRAHAMRAIFGFRHRADVGNSTITGLRTIATSAHNGSSHSVLASCAIRASKPGNRSGCASKLELWRPSNLTRSRTAKRSDDCRSELFIHQLRGCPIVKSSMVGAPRRVPGIESWPSSRTTRLRVPDQSHPRDPPDFSLAPQQLVRARGKSFLNHRYKGGAFNAAREPAALTLSRLAHL